MSFLWSLFWDDVVKKIPYQVWLLIGLALAFWAWGRYQHHSGEQEVQRKWDASIERGNLIIKDLKLQQKIVTVKTVTVYKDRIKVVHEQGETITKLIPQYIPADTCYLPGGFRLLHDAATDGTIPGPPTGADAIPVSAQEVAGTITGNYTTCRKTATQLISLIEWLREQKQLYLEYCKRPEAHCSTDK